MVIRFYLGNKPNNFHSIRKVQKIHLMLIKKQLVYKKMYLVILLAYANLR